MHVTADQMDNEVLRRAFGAFPSGVVALCAVVDGSPQGMVASSFVTVSLDPPLVAFCVQWTSTTWPQLEHLPRIGVSVLGEAHDTVARQLASKVGNRFADLPVEVAADGAVFLHGAGAWLDCSVDQLFPAGDHGIVLLRMHALTIHDGISPLVFAGSTFRRLAAVAP
ncbi:MAG: hsaB [Modestobacter sp.]|jgi:flavin reductase (DIM6/NTAB) family NADH-FMN oxidoreductase RutF|nr:hsaB [Modestobacter sp.]